MVLSIWDQVTYHCIMIELFIILNKETYGFDTELTDLLQLKLFVLMFRFYHSLKFLNQIENKQKVL